VKESEDEVELAIANLIPWLVEQGSEPPFYFAAIASNGHTVVGFFDRNREGVFEASLTAEYEADGRGLLLPINMMATDKTGRAGHLLIAQDGRLSKPTTLH